MLTDTKELVVKYKKLLDELIMHGKSIGMAYNNDINKIYSIFLKRQISLAESIKILLRKKRYYDACILTASLAENFILVKYLILYGKIQDYVDYHCIETFPIIKQYPRMKEEALKAIEEHNLKRFLKSNKVSENVDLLNFSNYQAPWKNIQAMVDQIVKRGDKDIATLKFNYDILCSYKHSGSYTLLSRTFDVPPENDAMIVLGTVCMILLHQFAVVAQDPKSLFFKNQVKLKEKFESLSEIVKQAEEKKKQKNFPVDGSLLKD